MPLVLLTVPPYADAETCAAADEAIRSAIKAEGVEGGVTVWPIKLAMKKKRLLLEYKSRQAVSDPTRLARVMAESVEKIFLRQVEAAVIKLDPSTTGLHITPNK
jgi:hypothetical protein